MSVLLIDIGNTRIKWQLQAATPDSGQGDWSTFQRWLEQQPTQSWQQVVAASVKQMPSYRTALELIFGQRCRWLETPQPSSILQPCYAEPERLGVDRWLAMLGAITLVNSHTEGAHQSRQCLIVDAGTALTVDYIHYDIDATSWQHLGGWIVPGIRLTQDAIFGHADRVIDYSDEQTEVAIDESQQSASQIFGQDTVNCVALGAKAQQVALVDWVQRQFPQAAIFITGGDGESLADTLQLSYQPDLIFAGLELLCAPSSSALF